MAEGFLNAAALHYACKVLIHAVGMVCGLGAATLATVVAGRRDMVALIIGFGVATVWLRPEPVWIGGMVALVAAFGLVRSRSGPFSAVVAGALAGLWGQVLQSYGLPVWSAVPLAAALPSAAIVLARRSPRFAPPALREDARLAVCVLGLVVAAAPTLSRGWQSAAALNLDPGGGTGPAPGLWVMLGLGAVVSLGGLHTLWRRG